MNLINALKHFSEEYEWFINLFGFALGLFGVFGGIYKLIAGLKESDKKSKTDWKKVLPATGIVIACLFVIAASAFSVYSNYTGKAKTLVDDPVVSESGSGEGIGAVPDEEAADAENSNRFAEETENDADTGKTTVGSVNNNTESSKTAAEPNNDATSAPKSTTVATKAATTTTTKSDPVIESGNCGESITYTLYESGLLELNGTGEMTDKQVWKDNCGKIKKVRFEGYITTIGSFAFSKCTGLTSITIPNSVYRIGIGSFQNCKGLTSITIPKSVKTIDAWAFAWSGIKSITIPDSVTSIGDYALSYTGLTSIVLPTSLRSIELGTFSGCKNLKSITLPDSVGEIGTSSFEKCSDLKDITISKNVTEIGKHAFDGCTSLADVYYKGAERRWNSIEISRYGNDPLTNATIHFNS